MTVLGGFYAFLAIVDPYDMLPLSPALDRKPVTSDQRKVVAGVARKARFDSAVFGSSTAMLLDPADLDRAFGGRFATLTMGAATRYEQTRALRLFMQYHPGARRVILSIGPYWLDGEGANLKYGAERFPEYMYDESPWNEYAHLLDLQAIRHAGLQLWQVFTGEQAHYRADGYRRFVPETQAYDPAKVHEKLYGEAQRRTTEAWQVPGLETRMHYKLDELRALLALVPPATEKILMLPPLHVVAQPPLRLAKEELAANLRDVPSLRLVDLQFPSRWTKTDANWWDPAHYTVEIASEVCRLLAASGDRNFESDVCRVLLRTYPPQTGAAR